MPLGDKDRRFLDAIYRFKTYLLVMGISVLLYLLLAPSEELQMATSVVGLALCGMFYLTQRLLSLISVLDFELTRLSNSIKRTMPLEERKHLFGS